MRRYLSETASQRTIMTPMYHPDLNGKELWDIQSSYLDKFYAKRGWPKPEELEATTKDYLIHLIKEATEVLDEVSWKMHRPAKEYVDRDNLLEEMVDVQKYLWALMQIWGVTWDQFREEFKRKSMVVEQRFAQEQSLPQLANHPCAIVDIDGVLADYPRCFEIWCEVNFFPGISRHDMQRLLREMPALNRADLKHKYRQSGVKADLPVLPGAREFLQLLRSRRNLKVILLTNRPYHQYYRIYPDTLEWLAKNDLPYDGIVWAQDKGVDALKLFKNICWAVDDSEDQVANLRRAGITTIKVDPSIPGEDTQALYLLAAAGSKIEDLGFKWNEQTKGALL